MPCPNLSPGFRLSPTRTFTPSGYRSTSSPSCGETAPIWWNHQAIGKGGFNDGGFWVVTKHKDVKEVSLRSDVFSTYQNTAIPRIPR